MLAVLWFLLFAAISVLWIAFFLSVYGKGV